MAEFDESRIINALHPEKAEIGKKYWFADSLISLKECVERDCRNSVRTLGNTRKELFYPFGASEDTFYSFIYPYEEPRKKRMSNRQLAEWLTKGHGQYSSDRWSTVYTEHDYDKKCADEEVPEYFLICPWGFDSNNWLLPTEDIYLRDCK